MRAHGWKIDHSRPTALYKLFDATEVLLYVGIAFVPEARWRAHAKTAWGKDIARNEVAWFPDRRSARALELQLIRTLQPPHNVAETLRKKWKAATLGPAPTPQRPKPLLPSVDQSSDVMIRLAQQVRREARSRARLERWLVVEYEEHGSLRDIAETVGLSHEQVRRILIRNGVQIRGRGRAPRPVTPES